MHPTASCPWHGFRRWRADRSGGHFAHGILNVSLDRVNNSASRERSVEQLLSTIDT
jgi:hypothetical protein